MLIDPNDPRRRPVSAQGIRDEEEAEQRRIREIEEEKLRDVENALTDTHRKLFEIEKAEVLAGRPDPGWVTPTSAIGITMDEPEAKEFIREQSELFRVQYPEYRPSKKKFDLLKEYLLTNRQFLPTSECWALAVERLTAFGLIPPEPEPASEPVTVEQPVESEPQAEKLTDGFDIETGEPRKYTQREIWRMSSTEYKKAFKLWYGKDGVDRTPTFHRSRYE